MQAGLQQKWVAHASTAHWQFEHADGWVLPCQLQQLHQQKGLGCAPLKLGDASGCLMWGLTWVPLQQKCVPSVLMSVLQMAHDDCRQ